MRKKQQIANKDYMSIDVSVPIWKFTARNNFRTAQQDRNSQSTTANISERYKPINQKRYEEFTLIWIIFRTYVL